MTLINNNNKPPPQKSTGKHGISSPLFICYSVLGRKINIFVWENVAGCEVTDACDHLCATSNTRTHLPNSSNMSKRSPEKLCVVQTLELSNDKVSVLLKKTKKSIAQNFEKIKKISQYFCSAATCRDWLAQCFENREGAHQSPLLVQDRNWECVFHQFVAKMYRFQRQHSPKGR